ncbi:hypothetical protein [Xanthobacter autotrophicus]|uniref:hypothetical protein n=1 Tax=Xanthobacter autotrophicus TaxID=280 RepID=UPI003726FB05
MDEAIAAEASASARAQVAMKEALDTFRHYYRWLATAHGGSLNDQAADAEMRIRQAVMILTRIDELLAYHRQIEAQIAFNFDLYKIDPDRAISEFRDRCQGPTAVALKSFENSDWLHLLTEQFYWVTFRARSALRHLPDLGKFDAQGVRNMRNKLIEHPEGRDSLIFNAGFGFGGPRGPILAASRTDQQSNRWPDAGLFPNAEEFATNLVMCIGASAAGPPTNVLA